MPRALAFLMLCAASLSIETRAAAIVIEVGPKQRIGGFLEKEDFKQITLRFKSADGKDKIEVFDKSKVKVIHRVDRARLEKLDKDKPAAYRDYADELADKTNDPEAMELALRLYIIAAYLDPATHGRTSLLNMSAIASRPTDARKYRAMAFLLDAKSNAGLLKVEAKKSTPTTVSESKGSLKAIGDFQKAMKQFRAGDVKNAKSNANEKGVAELFPQAGMKDQKSFLQACTDVTCTKCKAGKAECATCNGKKVVDPTGFGAQPCTACNGKGTQTCTACDGAGKNAIPEDYLRSVLRAEIWALDQMLPPDPAAKTTTSGGWANAAANPTPPIPLFTLETITEFDPRKCVYRNGVWQLP